MGDGGSILDGMNGLAGKKRLNWEVGSGKLEESGLLQDFGYPWSLGSTSSFFSKGKADIWIPAKEEEEQNTRKMASGNYGSKKLEPGILWKVHVALVLVQLGYGSSYVLNKVALTNGVNPIVFAVYRDIICLIVLIPLAIFAERLVLMNYLPQLGKLHLDDKTSYCLCLLEITFC